jgi:Fe-S-cluster formation regulator IscX/YfhJ
MEKNVYLEKALLFYETTVETYKCLVENKLEKFICLTKMKKLEKINENNNIQFKLKQNELQKQITEEQEKNRKLQIKNEELLRVIENNMEKEKNLQNQILDEQKLNKDLQTSNERLLEIIENNKLEEKNYKMN